MHSNLLSLIPTCFLLLVGTGPCLAGQMMYVSKEGNDHDSCTNVSSPCLTIQYAINQVVDGGVASISVGDGVYTEALQINYSRFVGITGNCANPGAVTLKPPSGDLTFAMIVQDHAIGVAACVDFASDFSGSYAIGGRKHALVDYVNVRFNNFAGGAHVSVSDNSIANCGGQISILGTAITHAQATFNSSIQMGCAHYVTPQLYSNGFVGAQYKSVVNASVASFSGPGIGTNSLGYRCIATDATITSPPGGFPGTSPCQLSYGGQTVP
jgi:hypothetical protein